jgi:hypothetical protein
MLGRLALPSLVALVVLAACGRSPQTRHGLLVQVVDEAADAVPGAEVILFTNEAEYVDRGRANEYGIASFDYPGNGTYRIEASTDITCCVREGSVETVLTRPDAWVVLETATGPCPTWVPEGC